MKRFSISPWFLRFLAAAAIATIASLEGCSMRWTEPAPYDDEVVYADDEGYVEESEDPWYMFRDLDYYGMWYWVEPFGWVWRPTVVLEWRPFMNGTWIWTEYGWTWVSYEPFGWATCHYGYWAHDFAQGWVWVPDYDWWPARVQWYLFDDVIAWAPIPWEGFYWEAPWERGDVEAWVVVTPDKFTEPAVGRYHHRVRFKSQREPLYRAPELATVGGYAGHSIVPIKIQLEQRTFGNHVVQRIALPPDLQAQVNGYSAQREQAFKDAYRERNGFGPMDHEQPKWHRGDDTATRQPRETRKKKETEANDEKTRQTKKPPENNGETKKEAKQPGPNPHPPKDVEQPPKETKQPPKENGRPAEKPKQPVEKVKQPARDTKEPAKKVKEPARDTRQPAEKAKQPARKKK